MIGAACRVDPQSLFHLTGQLILVIGPGQFDGLAGHRHGLRILAGLGVGLFTDLDDIRRRWKTDRVFTPDPTESYTAALRSQWEKAIRCTRDFGS